MNANLRKFCCLKIVLITNTVVKKQVLYVATAHKLFDQRNLLLVDKLCMSTVVWLIKSKFKVNFINYK